MVSCARFFETRGSRIKSTATSLRRMYQEWICLRSACVHCEEGWTFSLLGQPQLLRSTRREGTFCHGKFADLIFHWQSPVVARSCQDFCSLIALYLISTTSAGTAELQRFMSLLAGFGCAGVSQLLPPISLFMRGLREVMYMPVESCTGAICHYTAPSGRLSCTTALSVKSGFYRFYSVAN